jgi:hypothetical protein
MSAVEPDEANGIWLAMVRDWRRHIEGFYVRVAEFSDYKKLHFHVLCSAEIANYLEANWVHGHIDVQVVYFSDLDRVCNYMAKDFANSSRPYKRRYVAKLGSKPKVEEFDFESLDDALQAVAESGAVSVEALDIWLTDTDFGIYGEVKWSPGTHS